MPCHLMHIVFYSKYSLQYTKYICKCNIYFTLLGPCSKVFPNWRTYIYLGIPIHIGGPIIYLPNSSYQHKLVSTKEVFHSDAFFEIFIRIDPKIVDLKWI